MDSYEFKYDQQISLEEVLDRDEYAGAEKQVEDVIEMEDETILPIIGSQEHATRLACKWANSQPDQIKTIKNLLSWKISE